MGKPDGGPAFPQSFNTRDGVVIASHDFVDGAGMSLRDYFAAHAPTLQMESFVQGESSLRIDAARAWRWADALLAERDR